MTTRAVGQLLWLALALATLGLLVHEQSGVAWLIALVAWVGGLVTSRVARRDIPQVRRAHSRT